MALLIETLAGLSLVIASACVFNNWIDRDIDKRMRRTKNRALVTGRISTANALTYAGLLGIGGFLTLLTFTNGLVVCVVSLAYIFYIVFYGYAKRHGVYGTLVGTVPGAIPPVAGYLAVSGKIDAAAVILFLILVFWQLPHFYAIAMYRQDDYESAGLPVFPIVKGMEITKKEIMIYIAIFTLCCTLLSIFGYTGYIYLTVVLVLGIYWFRTGLRIYKTSSYEVWGKKMFFASLRVTMVLCLAIAFGSLLP